MIAIRIEGGGEIARGGVLVKVVSLIRRNFLTLGSRIAVADVVVSVAVSDAIDRGARQLGTGVVYKDIIHSLPIAGGAAGERATERVVAVGSLCYEGIAAMIIHTDEQVALRFVALGQRHVTGHIQSLQQVAARQIAVAKLLFGTTMHEARGRNTPIRAVAGGDGVLHRAVLGVREAGGAPHRIAHLGEEVGDTTRQQGIRFLFTVGVVANGAGACIVRRQWESKEIMSYKPFISCMLTQLAIILKASRRKFHVFSYNKPYNGGNDRQYNRNYNTIWVYFQP